MRNTLAQNIDKWVKNGATDVALEWIQYCVKFPIHNTIETFEIPNKAFFEIRICFYTANTPFIALIRPYRNVKTNLFVYRL